MPVQLFEQSNILVFDDKLPLVSGISVPADVTIKATPMLSTNVTKISTFVIFAVAAGLVSSACSHSPVKGGEPPVIDEQTSAFHSAVIIGKIASKEITESSGLVVSQCQENVLWTHNDSGDGPYVFAMDRTGTHLGTWKVANAENVDWEDISTHKDAAGKCFIYVGEIGNSKNGERTEHIIYRFAEPPIQQTDLGTSRENAAATEPATELKFSYPDRRGNAEVLLADPKSGALYIVTKEESEPAAVYKLNPEFGARKQIAVKVAEITVPAVPFGMLTGGDISPDGKRLVLCDYFAAYEFALPDGSDNFDEIWKQKPTVIALGKRKQGEAIAYSRDGNSILATSEGKNAPVIEAKRK